jgi:hypothetical protein
VIIHGHSLPPQKENIGEDTAKRVPLDKRVYFIPDALTSELMWIGVTTFILTVLVIWFYHAPLERHADPQVTPLGTTAPWYFLWIQGALKMGDKVLWGIIFPTVVIVVFMAIPYVDTPPSRRFADRRIMICFGLVLMSAFTILSFMGLGTYGVNTSADQEIIHEITHEPAHNKMGIILPVPYDQLVPGMYTTREFAADGDNGAEAVAALNEELQDSPATELINEKLALAHLTYSGDLRFRTVPSDAEDLQHVLREFDELLIENSDELHNGWGAVIITDNQDNLRRIDVIIVWEAIELDNGKPIKDENGDLIPILDDEGNPTLSVADKHIFIHRDSAYFSN